MIPTLLLVKIYANLSVGEMSPNILKMWLACRFVEFTQSLDDNDVLKMYEPCRLTNPTRLREHSLWLKLLFLLPLTISSSKTPKLYTSDFSEKSPSIAYSGGI
jgi:hypothetical protein